MTAEVDILVEERIYQLLEHLGIEQAHYAARLGEDWHDLANAHPEVIPSLNLACPMRMASLALAAMFIKTCSI